MKLFYSILPIILFATCSRSSYLSLKNNNQKQVIALVPFGDYNEKILEDLKFDLRDFYNKQVIVLKHIDIPEHYFNADVQQYPGDSLIALLKQFINDTIIEVAGFIRAPAFTMKKNPASQTRYYDENLLGIGHQPGNTCIISDFTFRTEYQNLYSLRLKKVVIHEIGHNLGLSHCPDDKCVMSEKNGSTINLDNNGGDYCQKCKKILYN